MNHPLKIALGVLLLLGVAAGGYWYGRQEAGFGNQDSVKDEARTLLYYRNPMGLPDTSPVPKKDSMGMDYIPVYAGEEPADNGSIRISTAKVQRLGVQSEAVAMRALGRNLRLSARIETDEQRLTTIAPKFEGWVERLFVNTTGQAVKKGQPLFEVYSPELVSALRELALAKQGLEGLREADAEARRSMQRLADASAARLKNWDIADAELRKERILYRAPADGIVLEKQAIAGMRFMPGEMLYRIADLSTLWVIADVPEQDIGGILPGSTAQVTVEAYPGRRFEGRVDFIYPTLNTMTRTVPLRIVLHNADGALKPGMYAQAQVAAGNADAVLAVPVSAVIDSGTRQTVLVRLDEGRFEPRAVTLGRRGDDYVEVRSGLEAGEQVVTSANFLLDSESNLKAALGGMGNISQDQGRSDFSPTGQVGLKPDLQSKAIGHKAQGMLEAVNDDGTVSITHEPIPALKWPAMTMDFALASPALAADIKPGSAIGFEIVERGEGEWVVTKLQAQHGGH